MIFRVRDKWIPAMGAAAQTVRRELVTRYSPSSFLFAAVIALGIFLLLSAAVYSHYFSIDIVSSLSQFPDDTFACSPVTQGLGVHCFGDYALVRELVLSANPWAEYKGFHFNYPAAGTMPHYGFAYLGAAIGSARVGLALYLAALFVALAVPAWWASRGKSISVRLVTVASFGVLAVPSVMVLDRGNSIGFVAPVLLWLFVGLRRNNDLAVVLAITVATMIKPQFVILLVLLIAMRRWKLTLVTLGGIALTNLLPYLLWPQSFPGTIVQSIRNLLTYGGGVSLADEFPSNVSFAKGLNPVELLVRRVIGLETNHTWIDSHQNLVGAAIAGLLILAIVILGRRVPAWQAALLLAAAASMLPGVSWGYYLVFALPIAAIVLRDPALTIAPGSSWHGAFDDWTANWPQRIAAFILVLATALTVSRVLLPDLARINGQAVSNLVKTSAEAAPLLWIVAIVAMIVSWIADRRSTVAEASTEKAATAN